MPYNRKGKCVYKKNTGKKVGCSKTIGKAKKYLTALQINASEEEEHSFNETYKEMMESLRIFDKYKGE
jgi:hypothetical protein